MAFSICFTGEPDQYLGDDPNVPYAMGRIVAGGLDEGFASTLYEWSKSDYEAQWLRSLEQLIVGSTKVALITQYVNPSESSNLEWWALYRGENDMVYVQNHLRFYDQLGSDFSVADASRFLAERITVNGDGNRISEWEVPFTEIKLFVDRFKQ
jgi:contact-dependent growth inhibition (CDI) system CdiI-like immunity protein